MISRLVIATHNPGKREEMTRILEEMSVVSEVVCDADFPDVEEVGETLEENALLKARAAMTATGLPALADDTGLEVTALGGLPGVHTARYAGEDATFDDNIAKLLTELEGVSDRSARFVTVLALVFPDGSHLTVEGWIEGKIAHHRRGEGGFGYDPVFEVGGRTFSEMGPEEKNRLSHRALALKALGEKLGR